VAHKTHTKLKENTVTIAFRAPETVAKLVEEAEVHTGVEKSVLMRRLTLTYLPDLVAKVISEQERRIDAAKEKFHIRKKQ
jgi:hypothetical protein